MVSVCVCAGNTLTIHIPITLSVEMPKSAASFPDDEPPYYTSAGLREEDDTSSPCYTSYTSSELTTATDASGVIPPYFGGNVGSEGSGAIAEAPPCYSDLLK